MSKNDLHQFGASESNKFSSQAINTYAAKTPFLIEDILYQHHHQASRTGIVVGKSGFSSSASDESSVINNNNNKSSTKSTEVISVIHANEEDYRKMLQNER